MELQEKRHKDDGMKRNVAVFAAALAICAFSQYAFAEEESAPEAASADAATKPQLPDKGKTSGKVVVTKEGGKITKVVVDSNNYGPIEVPENLWKNYTKFPSSASVAVSFEKKDDKLVATAATKPFIGSPSMKRR